LADPQNITRRTFIAAGTAAGAALVLGFYIRHEHEPDAPRELRPNAWLRITPDDNITVLVEIPEIGQGSRTVDTMMLAEELEVDFSKIRVEQAPVAPAVYKNLGTGGSDGTRAAWNYMREVGAQAREMLVTAAAQHWQVPKRECHAERGNVIHAGSGQRLSYGALVEFASRLPVHEGEDIPLKEARDFRFIGKGVPRVDVPSKVDGSATFGIDVRVPGMLFAVIARCPYFGGTLRSFDATEARSIPGVRAVFTVPPIGFLPKTNRNTNVASGVAVVADSTWAAMQGRKALKISWDRGRGGDESTASLRKRLEEGLSAAPAFVAIDQGNSQKALEGGEHRVEAVYELPFQAHATMEPMNTTVHVHQTGIEVWSPTQIGNIVQDEIASLSGIPANKITVHMMLCGGSFGRRYQYDYPAEAWYVANEMKGRPVQLLWTREDDMQHDFYRQYSVHRLSGALDARAKIAAWWHRLVSTPIRPVFDPPEKLKDPKHVASQELSGAEVVPYQVSNLRVDYVPVDSPVPRAWWRSVEASFNAFAVECFVDELAHAVHHDPYLFRMSLLREHRLLRSVMNPDDPPLDTARFRETLRLAAEKSGWNKPMPPGYGRGIACHYAFGSYLAHVAEVSVNAKGNVRVHRVVSAVSCGTAVNPDGVRAMTEGAINFALTPVLSGEITIKDGATEQTNFDGYQVLRIGDAPDVEVHILPGDGEPGGMGETGVPPLAPAVANAVFAATGKRVRRLPIEPEVLIKRV
jgi:isoquinoline 1-oxidoreductase beta subunit